MSEKKNTGLCSFEWKENMKKSPRKEERTTGKEEKRREMKENEYRPE